MDIKDISYFNETLKRTNPKNIDSEIYVRDTEFLLSTIKSLEAERDKYKEALEEICSIPRINSTEEADAWGIAYSALNETPEDNDRDMISWCKHGNMLVCEECAQSALKKEPKE